MRKAHYGSKKIHYFEIDLEELKKVVDRLHS